MARLDEFSFGSKGGEKGFISIEADFSGPLLLLRSIGASKFLPSILDGIANKIIERIRYYMDRGGLYSKRSGNSRRSMLTAALGNEGPSLINSGELFHGLSYDIKSDGTIEIGFSNKKLADIAVILEYGASIGIATSNQPPPEHWRSGQNNDYGLQISISGGKFQRMQAFIMATLRATGYNPNRGSDRDGRRFYAIFIPARPFLAPGTEDVLDSEFIPDLIFQYLGRIPKQKTTVY